MNIQTYRFSDKAGMFGWTAALVVNKSWTSSILSDHPLATNMQFVFLLFGASIIPPSYFTEMIVTPSDRLFNENY